MNPAAAIDWYGFESAALVGHGFQIDGTQIAMNEGGSHCGHFPIPPASSRHLMSQATIKRDGVGMANGNYPPWTKHSWIRGVLLVSCRFSQKQPKCLPKTARRIYVRSGQGPALLDRL